MPVVDIEWVAGHAEGTDATDRTDVGPPAQALADALGRVFGVPPGRCWVRLRRLDASDYAENDASVAADERPVFVTLQHARPPWGAARDAEMHAVTDAVAAVFRCTCQRVHVRYAPAAAGEQAFGGRWVG